MYFLDTCICIEFLRGRLPEAYEMFKELPPKSFALPALVEAELRLGIAKRKSSKALARLEAFLEPFAVIPFDGRCAQTYATVRAELEDRGQRIGPNDLIIAATALAHNAVLVTRNEKEFKRIPYLSLEVWDVVDAEL